MISVVIPLYNKADFIAKAVDSVLAQAETDWELIVVDDGSSDGGPEIVERYPDQRIKLVRQRNAGVSAARNEGARLASSDWVAFLDADDYWAPAHLSGLRTAQRAWPEAVACASAYYVVGAKGECRAIRLPADQQGRATLLENYFAQVREHEHPIHSSAIMVKRDVFLKLGGFPVGVTAGEDIIMWSRLACAGAIGYWGVPTAYYVAPPIDPRVRDQFLRRPQTPDPVALALKELMSHPKFEADIRMFLADWHRIRGMLFLERDERDRAWQELRAAVGFSTCRFRDVVSVLLLCLPLALRRQVLSVIRSRKQAAA